MRFEITAGELADALTFIERGLNRKLQMPVLGAVRIAANADSITLRANDLDIATTAICAADVEEGGEVAVNAKALTKLIDALAKGAVVSFETEASRLLVLADQGRYRFEILPLTDLPPSFEPDAAKAHKITLSADEAVKLFTRTAFAMSADEVRYYLNGVYLHDDSGRLFSVATDGHLLARAGVHPAGAEPLPGVIVPRRTVEQIVALIKQADALHLRTDANTISIGTGSRVITSKLVDGTFPDYVRVIPEPSGNNATVDRVALLGALERFDPLADKHRCAGATWHAGDEAIALNLSRQDDVASDLVPATTTGEADVSFSIPKMIALLESMTSTRAMLDFGSYGSPIRITPIDDSTLLNLLMPMVGRIETTGETSEPSKTPTKTTTKTKTRKPRKRK